MAAITAVWFSPIALSGAYVPKFKTTSVKPCTVFAPRPLPETPGVLQTGCTSLQRLIQQAFGLFANGHMNPAAPMLLANGPTWINADLYQIDAQAPGQSYGRMNGPMLQALLEDKFQLKVHRESEEVPVYALTAITGALKLLEPFQGTCVPWDSDDPPAHLEPELMCSNARNISATGFELHGATIADLCMFLGVNLDRPVLDQTGITGRFNFHLEIPSAGLRSQARGLAAFSPPAANPRKASPEFLSIAGTALKKLGLRLEATTGAVEFLVIDSIAKP